MAANLDLRLVTAIGPEDQVRRLVDPICRQGYHVVYSKPGTELRIRHPRIVRFTAGTGYPAVRTPLDHPAARALVAAVKEAVGPDVVVVPTMGASVPGSLFPRILGAAFVSLPIVNPYNNQHSPNENLRLGHLFDGIVSLAAAMRMELDGAALSAAPVQ